MCLLKQGINPDIVYSIEGSSDFFITGGYLFMTKALPDSTVSFKVSLQVHKQLKWLISLSYQALNSIFKLPGASKRREDW